MHKKTIISLDVGEKRIGIAVADTVVKIAVPLETLEVDGNEIQEITNIVSEQNADVIVVGYPRNQSGEPTAQTKYVEDFVSKLQGIPAEIEFQDESLTSVTAESRLNDSNKQFTKSDIDAEAAAIILQDYIEVKYGR